MTFLRPLAVSVLLHGLALGGLTFWLVEAPAGPGGRTLALSVLDPEAPPLPEDAEPLDVPELEEIPVVAEYEPAVQPLPDEPPPDEPDLELPPLPGATQEADLAMHHISIQVVRARTKPHVEVLPAAPPPPAPVVVAARVPPPPPPPPPRRAAGGPPRGRLQPISMPRTYPETARRMGLEGRAVVLVTIAEDGRIVDATLVQSAGHPILDQAALSSARAWRFQPPGEMRRLRLPFNYTLR